MKIEDNERACPQCNQVITYKNKYVVRRNEKLQTVCNTCSGINRGKRMLGKKGLAWNSEQRAKIIAFQNNRVRSQEEIEKAKETVKLALIAKGNQNVYSLWLKKYGKEEADKRDKQYRNKQSVLNSGEKNNMFGKPSPSGSGNGWKCRYKGIFFRSLRELSFFIEVIEKQNLTWESGEKRKFSIPYIDWKGTKRNYFPDYIVGNIIYECKPLRLWNSPSVVAKKIAAEEFCKQNGGQYILVDQPINTEIMKELFLTGKITFDDERYNQKFRKYLNI